MVIKCIVFDLGAVVLTNDWHYKCPHKDREVEKYFGLTPEQFDVGWNAFWPLCKTGKMNEDEFWKRLLQTAGAKKIDINKIKKIWRKYQASIGNMPDLVRKLKKNYGVAALTNIGKEFLDFKLKKSGLDTVFDIVVSSCHEGIAKPEKKIYEILLQKVSCKPEECVFTDNKERCLKPAKEMGINTILFTSQKQLENDLRKLGIDF